MGLCWDNIRTFLYFTSPFAPVFSVSICQNVRTKTLGLWFLITLVTTARGKLCISYNIQVFALWSQTFWIPVIKP